MSGSHCLILAAALALVLGAPGCKGDYKAPEPKADAAMVTTLSLVTSFAVPTLRW